ncbi:hypothetical protein F4678DRAFT_74405 [Xylaria arbuscula]|nr:hypothetical protein F4678DRAFT_74405 [Xylaria arbuscula]
MSCICATCRGAAQVLLWATDACHVITVIVVLVWCCVRTVPVRLCSACVTGSQVLNLYIYTTYSRSVGWDELVSLGGCMHTSVVRGYLCVSCIGPGWCYIGFLKVCIGSVVLSMYVYYLYR